MRRAERLFRLVNELRTRGTARASDLSAALEVSLSTIYRDVAHLQASGLPIDGAAGVGYLLRPGFDLPNVTFTHDQLDALAIGLAHVERTGDPALAHAAREARAKLQAALPDPDTRKLMDAPYFSLHARSESQVSSEAVRKAIRNAHVLEIDYSTGGNTPPVTRRLRPLVIWSLPDGWMVSGWCELRADFRTFRGDRMTRLVDTGEEFIADEATGLDAFMATEGCHDA